MRARGRGSIVQLEKGKPKARCRRWQVRVYVGRNPHTGKEQTKTRRVNGTYTDAVQALDDLRTEVKGLEYTKGSDLSLSKAAKLYLERRQEGRAGMRPLAPASADKQRWALNAVVRELGDVPVNNVTRRQVEDMLGSMQAGTGATGKRLSGAYCRTVFICLEQLFAFCIREGLVEKDPTEHVAPSPPTTWASGGRSTAGTTASKDGRSTSCATASRACSRRPAPASGRCRSSSGMPAPRRRSASTRMPATGRSGPPLRAQPRCWAGVPHNAQNEENRK